MAACAAAGGFVEEGVFVVVAAVWPLLDWLPASRQAASTEMNDPHHHCTERFALFIDFKFCFGTQPESRLSNVTPQTPFARRQHPSKRALPISQRRRSRSSRMLQRHRHKDK